MTSRSDPPKLCDLPAGTACGDRECELERSRDTIPAPPWHLLCSECRAGVEHFDVEDHADVVGYRHAAPACAAWREHRAVVVERSAFEEKAKSGKAT